MSQCQSCESHVNQIWKKRKTRDILHKIWGEDVLNLVGVPKRLLRQMSFDALDDLYLTAKRGLKVCQECQSDCRRGKCSPMMHKQFATGLLGSIGRNTLRMQRDRATMKDVEEEYQRRIQIQKTLRQLAGRT